MMSRLKLNALPTSDVVGLKYCLHCDGGDSMGQEHHLAFGPFHLDDAQGRLWQGDQVLPLRPQSLALLRYLVEHPGRLVTKTELRQHVWAGTHVSDTVLRVGVHEIRQALGDVAAAPRYLETVGRQGYRFLLGDALEAAPPRTPGPLVDRQGDVEAVEQCFQRCARRAPVGLAQWRSWHWQD